MKCNFLPSLLFPTRIQTATVEKGMYVFAPDWAGGAPRRRRGPGPPPRSPGVSATARWTLSVAPSARQPWHSLDRNSSLCGTSKKFRWLLPYEGEGVEGGGICLLYLIFFFFFLAYKEPKRPSRAARSPAASRATRLASRNTCYSPGSRGSARESGIRARSALGPRGKGLPGCPAVWGGRVSPGSVHCSFFYRQNASECPLSFFGRLFGVIKVTFLLQENVLV